MEKYNDIIEVIKDELYDENIIEIIKKDEKLNDTDRKFLETYKKQRKSTGINQVHYTLGKNITNDNLGRFYPIKCISLGRMRWDIRNACMEKYYWDIDLENCHLNIIYDYSNKNKLLNNSISEYVKNREKILINN
jgi:hypothetical protein